jgi:1,4-dihydroxy-6-naphthoate synthase
MVLRIVLGGDFPHRTMRFDEILPAVAAGEVAAGLLIHEGQLTYRDSGLVKSVDLGEWWLLETGLPLPLGVNTIRRDLGDDVMRDVSQILRASIDAALEHREEALQYALGFGRGMDVERGDTFVGMYVNELTCDYGDEGRQAVRELLKRAGHATRVEFVQ